MSDRISANLGPPDGMDPYLWLAQGSNFADYVLVPPVADLRYAFSVELAPDACLADLAGILAKDGLICAADGRWRSSRYGTGWVNVAGLTRLEKLHPKLVSRFQLASAVRGQRATPRHALTATAVSSIVDTAEAEPQVESTAATTTSKVLLGLIDSGCPFAHRHLRHSSGRTRVRAIWDQDMHPDFGHFGAAPGGFKYGAQVGAKALSALIRQSTSFGHIDESRCYERAGYSVLASARSHGSHTLGLLATTRASVGTRAPVDDRINGADVAFVQLPRDVLAIPSHAALCRAIIDGLRWIVEQAYGDERIVVAIPYAAAVGPHDGSSIFERALDDIISSTNKAGHAPRLQVILGAGNSYATDGHATLTGAVAGSSERLLWRVPPSSENAAFVEIWVPDDSRVAVSVTAPDGVTSDWASAGQATALRVASGAVCDVVHSHWAGDHAKLILVRVAPTRTSDGSSAALYGDWRINLRVDAGSATSGVVHAYASRGRGSFGVPLRGRPTKFVENDRTSKWRISTLGTISGMACGEQSTVVGGYDNWWPQDPAAYTSSAPGRRGTRTQVDYSAPSEEFPSISGVRSMGTRSGTTFRMDGGSVAVPQVARELALNVWPSHGPIKDLRLGKKL